MKKFLKRCVIIFLILVVFVSSNYLLNTHFMAAYHKAAFKETKNLILGGSRVLYINPDLMKNGLNLSDRGQTYKVIYYQLSYLSQFTELENLILSFSYLNISSRFDLNIKENYHSVKRMYPYVSPITLYKDTHIKKDWLKVISKYVFSFNLEYFGRYLKLVIFKLPPNDRKRPTEDSVINYNYYKDTKEERLEKVLGYMKRIFDDEDQEIGKLSIQYLMKIATLCKENNIQLHLVNMPLDPIFRDQIQQGYKNKFEETRNILVKEFDAFYHNYESHNDKKINFLFDPIHSTPASAEKITLDLLPTLRNHSKK